MTNLNTIQQLAKQIGTVFNPERVTLFGSYAYGHPGPDSDVDLLVIVKTKRSAIEEAVRIREKIRFPFPVDLMVRTPEDIERRIAIGDPLMQEIQTRGKILYEAA